jgi:hypothetical protein
MIFLQGVFHELISASIRHDIVTTVTMHVEAEQQKGGPKAPFSLSRF